MTKIQSATPRQAWNAGMIVGPKAPLKPKHIWEIRTRLKVRRAVGCDWLFPSRLHAGEHLTTRQ